MEKILALFFESARENLSNTKIHKRLYRSLVLLILITVFPLSLAFPSHLTPQNPNKFEQINSNKVDAIKERFRELPLNFEVNEGQYDPQVKFSTSTGKYNLFLTSSEAVFSLIKPNNLDSSKNKVTSSNNTDTTVNNRKIGLKDANLIQEAAVLRLKWLQGNNKPVLSSQGELENKSNYFIGNDQSQWRSNITHFSSVKYQDIYPGVDLVFYGNQKQLEYDLVVAPETNPETIKLSYDGAEKVEVNSKKELEIQVGGIVLTQHAPHLYQEEEGSGKRQIEGSYNVSTDSNGESVIGFETGNFDHSKPLIIDPVMTYSTYLGGSSDDVPYDIAIDSNGNAYVAGYTTSSDFPLANAFRPTPVRTEVFVSKLDTVGSGLIYSTYLGGTLFDRGYGIAVDTNGFAYVTGETNSADFPTYNGYQVVKPTGTTYFSAFVTKLSQNGNSLVYSTYLTGHYTDTSATAIAVSNTGNAYVVGVTNINSIPLVNAFQSTYGGDGFDGFITKFNANGSALDFSSYVGGSANDEPDDIALDNNGNAYITGNTFSTNFPVSNPLQGSNNGGLDAFVTKVNLNGSLGYSTYLGGSNDEQGNSVAVDGSGNAYIAGFTKSTNFPTLSAFQPLNQGGNSDAFITKLNQNGNGLVYSTYLGGSGTEIARGIAVDVTGNAYLTGSVGDDVGAIKFPTKNPFLPNYQGASDAFVTKISASGQSLLYSTYLGGSYDGVISYAEYGDRIAVDTIGNAYVTGTTRSVDFPTLNPYQGTLKGESDAFITKFNDGSWDFQSSNTTHNLMNITCSVLVNCTITSDDVSSAPLLFMTSNSGNNWVSNSPNITYPYDLQYQAVSCPAISTCYAVGEQSLIAVTTNGGGSWNGYESGFYDNLKTIMCVALTRCFAAGEHGRIIGTTNGTVWTSLRSNPNDQNTLNGIDCPSISVCYAVGDNGTILFTSNSGQSWLGESSGTTSNLTSISCIDTSICYIVGSNGIILRTANSGNTWISYYSATASNLKGISCFSKINCVAVGDRGSILTTPNGINWNLEPPPTLNNLNSVKCGSLNFCTIVGDSGLIMSNARMVPVTGSTDNGQGTSPGTLSYALKNTVSGQTITLAPDFGTYNINVTNSLPPLKNGVNLVGSCDMSGPGVTINGAGVPSGVGGLSLNSNGLVIGLKISGFKGPQLKAFSSTNKLSCMVVKK